MITTIQPELNAQQKMVADSLTRAFDELHAGEVRKDAVSFLFAEKRHNPCRYRIKCLILQQKSQDRRNSL